MYNKELEDKKKRNDEDKISQELVARSRKKNKFKGKRDPLASSSIVSTGSKKDSQ